MRLERKIGDVTYWLDVKDAWTMRDIRQWREASNLEGVDWGSNEAVSASESDIAAAKLALLQKWCSGCYLADTDGNEYRDIAAVTPDALMAMDAPLYQMVHSAASEAFARRASLGEARGGRS